MKYFRVDDKKIDSLGNFKIPRTWWSRFYEYAFAIDYLDKDLEILDAGCGLNHPFKDFAKDKVKKIVAIDKDENLKLLKDDKIEFRYQNIADLDKKEQFDVVFCLGVLHHDKENLFDNLLGLRNAIKEDGLVIITFDTTLDIDKFKTLVEKVGFEHHLEDEKVPSNAIIGSPAKVNVIKTILKLKSEKIENRKTKVEKNPKNKTLRRKNI